MSNNGAPDSWENEAEIIGEKGAKDSNDVSSKISTLNVNAMEFVPSFSKPSQASDSTDSPTSPQKSESGSSNSAGSPVLNGKFVLSFSEGNKTLVNSKFIKIHLDIELTASSQQF